MTRKHRLLAGVCCGLAGATALGARPENSAPQASALTVRSIEAGAWDALVSRQGSFTLANFRLDGDRAVDLRLERFSVTTATTRFVLGRVGAADEPLDFDPGSVALFRGEVAGYVGSHVYLALSAHGSQGIVELGAGLGSYRVSDLRRADPSAPATELVSFRAAGGLGLPPGVALCGVEDGPVPPVYTPRAGDPIRGLRQFQLAVETDNELYQWFNDPQATAAYVVSLYGAVSDIYIRDVGARVDLTFVRIWPTPDDLFNSGNDPLGEFANFWNVNMRNVTRDAAQLFSGRRNLRAGGVAYLPGMCGNNAYSWVGYAAGFFADPTRPDVDNRDIVITAHELGHNCGANHTHAYNIDTCDDAHTPARRGEIMAYCSQTVSGGDAVTDLRFSTLVRNAMRTAMGNAMCVVPDCNQNGTADALDISGGASTDANANGVPDECEDANRNGVLDSIDITSGTSMDRNLNAIPDEAEPDCNGNGFPDDMDIAARRSLDVHGNGIPDECEADLNGNGMADYNEIMLNMPLDKNRNTMLDAYEDCDGDGTADMAELNHAHNLWTVGVDVTDNLKEFYGQTGVLAATSTQGNLVAPQDLIITPDRRVLVTSGNHRVVEFDVAGAYVRDLVPAGSGGLNTPAFMARGANNALLVVSRGTLGVLEYDLASGAFRRALGTTGAGVLVDPYGIAVHPTTENVLVTSAPGRVLEFDGITGGFVRVFATASTAGPLIQPRGLCFKPDGNLLVASYANDKVFEYDGMSGAFVRQFNVGGVDDVLLLDGPWCIRVGPDRAVYVSRNNVPELHINRTRIYRFDLLRGWFLDNYVNGHDTLWERPTGFDFVPDAGTDCNRNFLPDSCDLSSGRSRDRNGDSIPDECQFCPADVDDGSGSGIPDGGVTIDDLLYYLAIFAEGNALADLDNGSGRGVRDGGVTIDDLLYFLARFANGC